jgi:hypothetical protein
MPYPQHVWPAGCLSILPWSNCHLLVKKKERHLFPCRRREAWQARVSDASQQGEARSRYSRSSRHVEGACERGWLMPCRPLHTSRAVAAVAAATATFVRTMGWRPPPLHLFSAIIASPCPRFFSPLQWGHDTMIAGANGDGGHGAHESRWRRLAYLASLWARRKGEWNWRKLPSL